MKACGCATRHQRKRIVLTGGPGAGKTAVLELVRQQFCAHVQVLPEAAGIVPPSPDFLEKAARTVEILRAEIPECCKAPLRELFPTSAD